MAAKRKKHSDEFKAKVAMEAIKGLRTTGQLSSVFGVHPTQITHWKRQMMDGAARVFGEAGEKSEEEMTGPLYEQIGRLQVEVGWLKKALIVIPEIKRTWIETDHPNMSIAHQCTLLGLARSSFYHEPYGAESDENLRLMRQIDELYLKRPFYGSPRMTDWLNDLGWIVNEKRVARLMRVMGIQAILPGPHTSRPHPAHRIYPYLLRGLEVRAANEVWCADITYVPLRRGFMYLIAIMDWFSRYVLAWALSNTQEVGFCVAALQQALGRHGPPDIFNTDQGAQFTSEGFIGTLQRSEIQVSMDGRGRALDNVFIERLWRSVKYEDVYPRDYADGQMMHHGLDRYFRFYNTQRRHQALKKLTPAEMYFENN